MELVLLRHGESAWNLENRFTGWTDVPLSDAGRREAAEAGRLMRAAGIDFDRCCTSYLKRAIDTLNLALGDSLRALVMYLERLTPEEIMKLNLPTGVPLQYRLNDDFSVAHKEWIGDADAVAQKMEQVANQGRRAPQA